MFAIAGRFLFTMHRGPLKSSVDAVRMETFNSPMHTQRRRIQHATTDHDRFTKCCDSATGTQATVCLFFLEVTAAAIAFEQRTKSNAHGADAGKREVEKGQARRALPQTTHTGFVLFVLVALVFHLFALPASLMLLCCSCWQTRGPFLSLSCAIGVPLFPLDCF